MVELHEMFLKSHTWTQLVVMALLLERFGQGRRGRSRRRHRQYCWTVLVVRLQMVSRRDHWRIRGYRWMFVSLEGQEGHY